MSAPDFKALLDRAGRVAEYPHYDDTIAARKEYERRLDYAVMRVVWEALEGAEQFLDSPHGTPAQLEILGRLHHAQALLNGTTPTDKKDE